jgi:hypothetical protein
MEFKAIIDFGKAKINLLINIYNWRVSYPNQVIYLSLGNITACFQFPRISADVTGALGFMVEHLYFLSTSHVFGSITSASSLESFCRAIQSMIPICAERNDLVKKHKDLLNLMKWDNTYPNRASIVKAIP